MFKCIFCGRINESDDARFCGTCGPNGPSKNWLPEEIDQPNQISAYLEAISDIFFESHSHADIDKFSHRIRARLKISYDAHLRTISQLEIERESITHLAEFKLEFNENVLDAFSGHDTHLSFRFTNLSEELVKVSLFWDDPETTDRIEFQAETKTFIKPGAQVIIGSTAIFDRIGPKEISDLQITVTDAARERAVFIAAPFTFKVGNPEANVTQYISTHNQISIEGRGVVDASRMGNNEIGSNSKISSEPIWRILPCSYYSNKYNESTLDTGITGISSKPSKSIVRFKDLISGDDLSQIIYKASLIGFNIQDNLSSDNSQALFENVKKVGEHLYSKGDITLAVLLYIWLYEVSESTHGFEHPDTLNLAYSLANIHANMKSYDQAIPIYKKLSECCDDDQLRNSLGYSLMNDGKYKNLHEAEYYLLLAAENGNSYAISNLGNLYSSDNDLHDKIKAEYWYKKGVDNNDNHDRRKLAVMYFEKNMYDDALKLLRDAAETNDIEARNIIKDHGIILMGAQKLDHAYRWLERAGKLGDKSIVPIMREQGKSLISEKKYDDAEKWLFRAYAVGDKDPESEELILCLRNNSLSKWSDNNSTNNKLSNIREDPKNKETNINAADYSNNVKNIIVKYKSLLDNNAILIKPRIPEKKITNVIGSYASGADSEAILMLYDNTVFGSAKDGFTLSTDTLYIHNMSDENKKIKLQDILSVKLKSGILKNEIHINDELILDLNIERNKISGAVLKVLEAIITLNND